MLNSDRAQTITFASILLGSAHGIRIARLRVPMSEPAGKRRVLVVDDYPDARDMYRSYLELCGFDVVEAVNGVEALARALDASPDVILMDLSLPIMDGWEATRRLKQDPRTADIPVVALTGNGSTGSGPSAAGGQWDAFVAKPCLPEDLVREIQGVLHVA